YEDMMRTMQINLGGVFAGCKYAMPYLRASRGSIINISSVLGHAGQEGAALYAATKGAIIAFTKSIACDEARNGVRINVLNPGDIHTSINDKEKANHMESIGREHIQWIPRQGRPSEVGTACLFLASSWASFITGSELFVDGGFFAGSGYKHARFDWTDKMEIRPL
ncbi:MAG: SDR family oxidoreductase, partial [Oscillibacter sp.]|nr:SDR family oxidoreductase [Oscillibacter sp.]